MTTLDTAGILRDMRALQAKITASTGAIRSLCNDAACDALLGLADHIGDAIPAVEGDLPVGSVPGEYTFPNNHKAV